MSRFGLRHILQDYHVRFLVCLVAVLLIAVAGILGWPTRPASPESSRPVRIAEQETITLEDIHPTRQSNPRPPPPAPLPPVITPTDEWLEEVEIVEEFLLLDDPGDDDANLETALEEAAREPSGTSIGPRPVRFVEPEYTRGARRRKIRAEIVVRVFVNKQGDVEESTIIARYLLGADGSTRTPVDMLGYGLEESALSAAERWVFRPARERGEAVASHKDLTFTFGT